MVASGPQLPRRRIAEELRKLRAETNQTLEGVANALLISTSKLSRLENAQGRPNLRDVRDLIRHYEVEGTQIAARLEQWTKAARVEGWWTEYKGNITDELGAHASYETEATAARVYTIPNVPVLLQTVDYARAYYRSTEPWRSTEDVERAVEFRMRRQKVLTERPGREPLRLVAVMHEACLHQFVGSAEIMREQLDQLIERSTAPNIDLRVLPFSVPPLFSFTGMYGYYEFEEDLDLDVVHIETQMGILHIEEPDQVAQYRKYHAVLYAAALPADDTRSRIRGVRNQEFS